MAIPDEFNKLCQHFHQDVVKTYKTPEDIVAAAVDSLRGESKRKVRVFLDELLSGRHTPGRIKRIWSETHAEIHFRKSTDAIAFLRLIQQAVSS